MVVVDDKKYACESCIKGHRSSSCGHGDRPLYEVKKKGRPVSQCAKCRELRKTKRKHSKCECSIEMADKSNMKQLAGNSKRYIPIRPALPNGIKDVHGKEDATAPANPRSKVDNLLNPCHCKDVYSCTCRNVAGPSCSGLDALVQAAALFSSFETTAAAGPSREHPTPSQSGSCCNAPTISLPSKRPRRSSSSPRSENEHPSRTHLLPPLQIPDTFDAPPPVFPPIPPLRAVASFAGSGCTCGFSCTCPGCEEHRGPELAAKSAPGCPDCGHCVDHTHGLELPPPTGRGSSLPTTAPAPSGASPATPLDAVRACAAAVPHPPAQRAAAAASALDPANVTVYPRSLFAGARGRLDAHGPAFGLVRLPKLACCKGRCGCRAGRCGCGEECGGCGAGRERSAEEPPQADEGRAEPVDDVRPSAGGGCCGST